MSTSKVISSQSPLIKTVRANRVTTLVVAAALAIVGIVIIFSSRAAIATYPTTPPAQICDSGLTTNPTNTIPAGAISVPAGDNNQFFANEKFANASGRTYWFEPGVHTLSTSEFGQIEPRPSSTYIGAPGSILDGQNINRSAFSQKSINVTIKYLTIQNFNSVQDQGVVNHDSADGWTIDHNNIINNHGAGVFVGSNNKLLYNCLKDNGQYGFQGFGSVLLLDHNEIVGNNTDDLESKTYGCGCTGGGKFWAASHVTITNNWVHHNKSMGLWADTNDLDFLVDGNYINDNDGAGLEYEISYNMVVRNNNFIRNAVTAGLKRQASGDRFPEGAIYISESGGETRLSSVTSGSASLEVYNNNFQDNWDGVVLWENSNRFGNDNSGNTSRGYTTLLVDPNNSGYGSPNIILCGDPAQGGKINSEPYYSDCRWKTQNVKVHDNAFSVNPAAIGCTGTACGRNGIFSNYGGCSGCPAWWPYLGVAIPDAITYKQNNLFSNNTYNGPWTFATHDQGTFVNYASWQSAPSSQDAGSTCSSCPTATTQPPPPPGTTPPPPPPISTTKPTMPQNLRLTNLTATQVSLAWDASTDPVAPVNGYTLYRDGGYPRTTGSTYAYDTDIVPGQTYTFAVDAYSDGDSFAHSVQSTPITVTVPGGSTLPPPPPSDTTPPTIPSNLTATATSATRVNLSWSASTDNVGVTNYYVVRNGTTIASLGNVSSYSDTSVSPSTSYQYYVLGADFAGNVSPASNTVTVATPASPDTTPPSTPTGLSASAVSSTQVNLTWSASTDNRGVTGYSIYRNGLILGTATTPSFGDATTTAGSTYSYSVDAFDSAGNHSAQSATTSITTPSAQSTLSGKITQAKNNSPITGAKVTISGNGLTRTTATDTLGNYIFTSLPDASYTLTVTKKPYRSSSRSITLTGGTLTVNITLTR